MLQFVRMRYRILFSIVRNIPFADRNLLVLRCVIIKFKCKSKTLSLSERLNGAVLRSDFTSCNICVCVCVRARAHIAALWPKFPIPLRKIICSLLGAPVTILLRVDMFFLISARAHLGMNSENLFGKRRNYWSVLLLLRCVYLRISTKCFSFVKCFCKIKVIVDHLYSKTIM